jgi:hypothetical protein
MPDSNLTSEDIHKMLAPLPPYWNKYFATDNNTSTDLSILYDQNPSDYTGSM